MILRGSFILNTLKEIISEHIKYRSQIVKLAKSDIIKTYRSTALGWTWAIIKPSITIAIYYFAFTVGLRANAPHNGFPYFLWLLAGIIPWFYVKDIFVDGAYSIRKYRYLVTKIKFPVATIPTFISLSDLLINLMLMAIVMVIFVVYGFAPDIYWLQLPLYILMMFMFFISWSLFAGILSAMSNDFLQLVKSLTMALFWTSGIMYDVSSISNETIRTILLFNPITVIVNGYRNSFIYKKWFWEDWSQLAFFSGIYIIMTLLAIWVYRKLNRDISDVL